MWDASSNHRQNNWPYFWSPWRTWLPLLTEARKRVDQQATQGRNRAFGQKFWGSSFFWYEASVVQGHVPPFIPHQQPQERWVLDFFLQLCYFTDEPCFEKAARWLWTIRSPHKTWKNRTFRVRFELKLTREADCWASRAIVIKLYQVRGPRRQKLPSRLQKQKQIVTKAVGEWTAVNADQSIQRIPLKTDKRQKNYRCCWYRWPNYVWWNVQKDILFVFSLC